ncbi:MAG: hypothetical protein AB3N10_01120, partial [Allomuricauda sp.]
KVSKKEASKIKILEQELFENFTVISICKAKLLLIGASNASKNLIAYHDKVREFYKYAHLENEECSEKSLIDYRDKMQVLRKEFFISLNKEYEKVTA